MAQPGSKEATEDRRSGLPPSRALSAMAVAVRRAREATQRATTPSPLDDDLTSMTDATTSTGTTDPANGTLPATAPAPTRRVSSWSEVGSVGPAPRPTPPRRPPPRSTSPRAGSPRPPSDATAADLEGLLRHRRADSVLEAGPPPRTVAPRPDPQPAPRIAGAFFTDPEWRERLLLRAVAALAILVVVGAIALIITKAVASPSGTSSPTVTTAPPAPAHRTTAGHRATSSHRDRGTTPSSASQTTLPPSTPGAAPVISSISPSSGGAGQSVTVAGANFMSANGTITASFGGQPAPVACPQQSTCTVTVPALQSPQNPVPLTITTQSGTSNTVDFTYSV